MIRRVITDYGEIARVARAAERGVVVTIVRDVGAGRKLERVRVKILSFKPSLDGTADVMFMELADA